MYHQAPPDKALRRLNHPEYYLHRCQETCLAYHGCCGPDHGNPVAPEEQSSPGGRHLCLTGPYVAGGYGDDACLSVNCLFRYTFCYTVSFRRDPGPSRRISSVIMVVGKVYEPAGQSWSVGRSIVTSSNGTHAAKYGFCSATRFWSNIPTQSQQDTTVGLVGQDRPFHQRQIHVVPTSCARMRKACPVIFEND